MSLVERAIKKMQAARETTPAGEPADAGHQQGGAPVIGQLVHTGAIEVPALRSGQPACRTDKVVRIDRQALRIAGLLPPENQEQVLANQYRQVKRPLIGAALGRGTQKLDRGQLVMMASAMPGEGKTFTSINLALSMALEKDLTVLLVDADVAKPHISRIFGVEDEPGLLNVLRDEGTAPEAVILATDVPNLHIMPAGRRSETATELLASQRMEWLTGFLASSDPRRVVLIDSPPLLPTTEARALAHWVGQVVMVVRSGFTPQQAVLDALEFLGTNKSVGLVLNQSITAPAGYYYGYGFAKGPANG